jgi:class 3 adenylate cyclase
VTGLAVHVAARLLTIAQPNEILVTRTLADLVAGADVSFSDRGRHALKGIPANGNCCRWRQAPEEALHDAREKASSAVPH